MDVAEVPLNPWRSTGALLAALGVLVAADVWVHRPAPEPELAEIHAFSAEQATGIALRHGDAEVLLAREEGAWRVVAPYDGVADPDRVAALLAGLGSGVPLDVRVDGARGEGYGLTGGDGVRVDVTGLTGVLASVVVGGNAEGGSTFLSVAGLDDVYRARIGGRSRYAVPAAGWRDHRMLTFSPDALAAIRVERPEGAYALVRSVEEGRVGPWTLEGDPAFGVDPLLAAAVGRGLASLRAMDVVSADVPSGLDAPIVTVSVGLTGGERHVLRLARSGDGAFASVDDRPEVYRVAPQLLDRLAVPPEAWRDHTLLAVDPASITEMVLEEPGTARVVLARTDGPWRITEPPNLDADPQRAVQVATFLAQLRVDAWLPVTPAEAGLVDATRIVVASAAGRTTIEIGRSVPGQPAGQEAYYVRNPRQPDRIGALPVRTVGALKSAWGR